MAEPRYILALDQGTTGSAAIVFDDQALPVSSADSEIRQYYPQPGCVEHDPNEILATTVRAGREALEQAHLTAADIAAIGITNQRETAVLWDRATGEPAANAVVWQSRASLPVCEDLKARGLEPLFHERTGLLLDPYFSGTKIRWLLDRIPDGQARAEAGEILFGTVESWLVWRLTGGRVHVTDAANASRTLLSNIASRDWDDDLLRALNVPRAMLPRVVGNAEVVGETDPDWFGAPVLIAGLAGDQQAALFGQTCFQPGSAKNTYGTGCFLLANTGSKPRWSEQGILTTLAWQLGGQPTYALEGGAFVTGAAVQWLRDGLGVIATAAETEALALSVPDTAGVAFVPAFVGLGAPYWDPSARGTILGLTGGATRAHIVRATLESIAFQSCDLAEAMERAGQPIEVLRVDGGGTANGFLMQLQADLLGTPVEVAAVQETTARGAALLAGLATEVWPSLDQMAQRAAIRVRYEPHMSEDQRQSLRATWRRAVERARGWAS